MVILLLIVLIVAGVVGSLFWIKKQARIKQELNDAALKGVDPDPSDESWPFDARVVMSDLQRTMYARMCQALPDYTVLAQVRLTRIVRVRREDRRAFWQNRIAQENADFVVCDAESNVVAVIELDERPAQDAKKSSLDGPMERALRAAGLPFLRWSAAELPDESTVQSAIAGIVGAPPAKPPRSSGKSSAKSGRSRTPAATAL